MDGGTRPTEPNEPPAPTSSGALIKGLSLFGKSQMPALSQGEGFDQAAEPEVVRLEHWRVHHLLKDQAEAHIRRFRKRVGLEEIWSIEVLICCPESEEVQTAEASVWWDAEVWYARMLLRCNLPPALFEWCVVHELCELQRWRSASCYLESHQLLLPGEQSSRLLEQYRQARNQEIELQVSALLGHRRPYHLTPNE